MSLSPPDLRRQTRTVVPALPTDAAGSLRRRADGLVGLLTAAVVVLLGAPAGVLWSALAPHATVVVRGDQAFIADAETEVFIAGDGWFVAITLLLGLTAGVLAWLVARRSGPAVVVGLAVGGAIAAYVAARVGTRIGQDELIALLRSRRPGTYVGNVALQAKTALAAWPLGAVAAFATLVASRADELE